ncbi:hypothetical protein ABEY24_06530 [Peribacillus frigoritolerans]|uniref:hypothetical protein n=1 Tax=Peribacillus frigoritolerans TaxID=450367 RepID=UPI003D2C35F5
MNNFYNHNSKIAKGCCTVPSNKHKTAKKEIECDCCCVPGCHKNQCRENKKHNDKKGLLTEFDFDEFNQNLNPTLSTILIPLANIDLCIDDKCDHILLNAAINWEPTGTRTGTLNLGAFDLINFSGRIRSRFTIWRGNPSNPNSNAVPICTFIDGSPQTLLSITTINLTPGTPPDFEPGFSIETIFTPVTTDFKCVDENPTCGEVEYFLTMNIMDPIFAGISLTGATAATLTAMAIKKNDECC